MCCGGDQAAALDLVDRLASKSLVVAEPAAGGPATGCWRPSASTPPSAWPRPARPGRPGDRHARRSLAWPSGNAASAVLSREQDNFRAALDWSLSEGGQAGPRLARALGEFWLARGFFQEAGLAGTGARGDPADPGCGPTCSGCWAPCCYVAGDLERRGPPWRRARGGRGGRRRPSARPGSASCGRKSRLSGRVRPKRSSARRPSRCSNPKTIWKAWPRRGCWPASCILDGRIRLITIRPSSAPPPLRGEAATTTRNGNPASCWCYPPGRAHTCRRAVSRAEAAAPAAAGDHGRRQRY